MGSPKSLSGKDKDSRRQLEDTRRAVKPTAPPQQKLTLDSLPLPKSPTAPLRSDGAATSATPLNDVQSPSAEAKVPRSPSALAQLLARLCEPCTKGITKPWGSGEKEQEQEPTKEAEPARRWYRVHPITDNMFSVRADAGIAGRTPGHPDAGAIEDLLDGQFGPVTDPVQSHLKGGFTRQVSADANFDRNIGLEEPPVNDSFVNTCKICYSNKSDVVVLPCKHGGMCEKCLVRALRAKPFHRGGTDCPLCRKKITEVIKLHDAGAINMYGYAIRVELLNGIAIRQ